LQNNNKGDDGFGSQAHLFAHMDDISATVAHNEVEFFCNEIDKLGASQGRFINPAKTRIFSGESIIPTLPQPTANSLLCTIQ
jgi:hypothetical protein